MRVLATATRGPPEQLHTRQWPKLNDNTLYFCLQQTNAMYKICAQALFSIEILRPGLFIVPFLPRDAL